MSLRLNGEQRFVLVLLVVAALVGGMGCGSMSYRQSEQKPIEKSTPKLPFPVPAPPDRA